MRNVYLALCLLLCKYAFPQDINHRLNNAINSLQADGQFKHAIISLYVTDNASGKVIYDKNAETGLAPASCQKIATSAAAFEILGKGFVYETTISSDGHIAGDTLFGNIHVNGSGDPTLGSWRWGSTKEERVLPAVLAFFRDKHINYIAGGIYPANRNSISFSYQPIPNGWVWEDIGNYYGAGAWALNWHENQYTLHLASTANVGDSTTVLSTDPVDLTSNIKNFITAGSRNSGDNGYIYTAPYSNDIYCTGTIPAGEKDFTIAGAIPNPPLEFIKRLQVYFLENRITVKKDFLPEGNSRIFTSITVPETSLVKITSPPLDSMNYWFLKKSINLYGEAFVKTMAIQNSKEGSTTNGVEVIKDLWEKKGIERSALNIIDGSGLSPANRVTTHALVDILRFAEKQNWFNSFYEALPEINGIKMKDGYITGVRSYAGYIKAKNGAEYTFSFIVNNVDGNAGAAREKIWRVLDLLK